MISLYSFSPPVRWGLLDFMSAGPPPPPSSSSSSFSSSSFGPQLQALDSRLQCSPPDLHHKLRIRVFPAGLPPQAPDQSVPRRTSTTSSGSECSPPDFHCKLRIRVFPAGPPPQAQDQRVPRRTSTASSGSECSPPDLHRKLRIIVFPAGPPPQAPDQSVPRRTSTASSGSKCSPPDLHRKLRIRVFPAGPPPQAPDQSVPRRTSTASSGSKCSPPDLHHKESPKIYQIECQIECQKIWYPSVVPVWWVYHGIPYFQTDCSSAVTPRFRSLLHPLNPSPIRHLTLKMLLRTAASFSPTESFRCLHRSDPVVSWFHVQTRTGPIWQRRCQHQVSPSRCFPKVHTWWWVQTTSKPMIFLSESG